MRVYGSSPLYNYVELVFRSKRLFIISVILATVVTVSVAAMRATTYSARALVLLSGDKSTTNFSADDPGQRGSIQYKLSVLNVVLKNPDFLRQAFRDVGLNKYPNGQTMSDEDYKKFCVEAHDALSTAVGGNIMELSCRWKDKRCVDIIKGFYDAYSRQVLDMETTNSTHQTQLLKDLNDEYTEKVKDLEGKIIAYKQTHTNQSLIDYQSAVNGLQNARDAVNQLHDAAAATQQSLNAAESELAKVPRTVETRTLTRNVKESVEYQQLEAAKAQTELKIQELLQKYSENAPAVRSQRDLLSQITEREKILLKVAAAKKTGDPSETTNELNPDWVNLNSTRQQLAFRLKEYQQGLKNRQEMADRLKKLAMTTPEEQYRYKWLSDKMEMYEAIRKNLGARLEQAQMDERKDREMHLAEMSMMVEPEAELDTAGGKSFIFLLAGPILGCIIAFAFSLLAETLDHSLRTPLEVEKYLGKPVLAVLPRMDTARDRKAAQRLKAAGGGSGYLPPSS